MLSTPAKEHAQFDKVMCPSSPIPIRAGDSIGHMGFYQAPKERGFESRYQVHIECFSDDDNLPLFLQNQEAIDRDIPRYLKCSPGLMLWNNSFNEPDVFVRSERVATHESLYTLSQLDIKQDKDKNEYYYLPEYLAYLPKRPDFGVFSAKSNDPENLGVFEHRQQEEDNNLKQYSKLLSQYDLAQLGFNTVISETNTFDYLPGLGKIDAPFISSIFKEIIETVELSSRPNKAIIAFNYKRLLTQMTSPNTTSYNPNEYRYMFHHPMFADVINKTIVKHHSDWYYTAKDAIWQPFLQYLAKDTPQWKAYSEEFIESMTWMQEVTKDKLAPSLWHMHPLVFLDSINTEKNYSVTFPLHVKPENNPDKKWNIRNWQDRKLGNMTVFGRNRSGGDRKHAAVDLYTNPYEPIYAISDGVVFDISSFYSHTDQISIQHKTTDGREFIVRYGEVDSNTVDVKVGQKVKQGQFLAKTGKLLKENKKTKKLEPEMFMDGVVVFMLHFEYYTNGANTKDKLTNRGNPPFQRRTDLADPFDLLMEGYINTFETRNDLRMDISSISLSEKGKGFIKKWESKKLKPYNDSEGYCTIGYGHLIGKQKCEDMTLSNDFKNGITDEKADELFDYDLIRFELAVKKEINVKLYQHEYDALVSLLFNCGSNFFSLNKAPKLLMLVNSEQYELAANEFLDITNNGVLGLVRRRSAEKDVFLNANY